MEKETKPGWWSERLGLKDLDYEVPAHANTILYSLGGIILTGVLILITTGIILTQFYRPDAANESVRYMMSIPLVRYVRGLHFWTAQLVMGALLLHVLRIVVFGSYRKPREVNWYIGVGLFAAMVGLFYTGTVIKWDQEAAEALEHTKAIAAVLGLPSVYFTGATAQKIGDLPRFFSLHVSILPLILVVLFAGHALLVKALKISPLPWGDKIAEAKSHGKHYFSQHLRHLAGYGLIFLGIVTFLAVTLPPPVLARPVEGIEGTRPPWVFMGLFSLENWFEIKGLLTAFIVAGVLLILVPLVDRARTNLFKDRRGMLAATAVVVALFAGLTVNSYLAKPRAHIKMGAEAAEKKDIVETGTTKAEPITNQAGPADALKGDLKALSDIVHGTEKAINNKDLAKARDLAEQLDDKFDSLAAELAKRDKDLVKKVEEDIHNLSKELKAPDGGKSAEVIEAIDAGIDKLADMLPKM